MSYNNLDERTNEVKIAKKDFIQNRCNKISNNCYEEDKTLHFERNLGTDYTYKFEIVWIRVLFCVTLHTLGLWGLYIVVTGGVSLKTFLWTCFINFLGEIGVTIGAHRLFTHKSYKVTPSLKAFLILCYTFSGQNTLFTWCRDHRLHHRYSDTDGDPHNAKRGFFFSHIGWMMLKKHPYVDKLGKTIDMSDLKTDWMVMFQYKYFRYLYFPLSAMPVVVSYYMGESLKNSFLVTYCLRYMFELNVTCLVNSAAHLYGTRPYDKKLQPVESWFVSLFALGEGWHNYHHSFPWDYKAAELDMPFNISAWLIRLFERMGLAYDLKSVDSEMVARRILKVGDGTHYALGNDEDKLSVTALGPLHPLNPSYNVKYKNTYTQK